MMASLSPTAVQLVLDRPPPPLMLLLLLQLLLFRLSAAAHVDGGDGGRVTVVSVSWDSAELSWEAAAGDELNASRTLAYAPNNSSTQSFVSLSHVTGAAERYAIRPLEPLVSYSVWLLRDGAAQSAAAAAGHLLAAAAAAAAAAEGGVNRTVFTTLEAPEDYRSFFALRKFVDHLLILCLLIAWLAAVCWFYQQFSSFHLRLPTRYVGYKQVPKNIETVQIISRAHDSIIYKSYNRQMSITMEKRATQRHAGLGRPPPPLPPPQPALTPPPSQPERAGGGGRCGPAGGGGPVHRGQRRLSLAERIAALRRMPLFLRRSSPEVNI